MPMCHLLSCVWLCPGSSVQGISQARIMKWIAFPFSRGSSGPRDQTHVSWVSCIAGRFINIWATRKAHISAAAAKSLQSCPTLWDPIDGSPPGSPIPGILQARTLEWVAISFSNAGKWKVKMKLLSCVRLLETPWTAALPGSSIHGSFQARVLEWGAIAFSTIFLI